MEEYLYSDLKAKELEEALEKERMKKILELNYKRNNVLPEGYEVGIYEINYCLTVPGGGGYFGYTSKQAAIRDANRIEEELIEANN